MKLCFGLLLALIAGCNKFHPMAGIRDISPGRTSLHEALKILEDPEKVTAVPQSSAQVFHWQEASLQVEHKIVQAIFREPSTEEKSFLYWRHSYRHLPTQLQRLTGSEQWQFNVPSEGLAVIYDGEADEVTKVIRYETP